MVEMTIMKDEDERVAALRRLEILDTEAEEPFEHVVSLVRSVLGVPMAAVSLVDEDRQWFKARAGIEPHETPRSVSLCSHAIRGARPFVVGDTAHDPRFADNPLVTGELQIRSYAGIPLKTAEGFNVGALCAMDKRPREFTAAELALLADFAKIVETEFQLRRIAERDQLTGALTRSAFAERAEQEIARFQRTGRPCTLVVADLDHFKAVNDAHGHPAGDAALRAFATLMAETKRPADLFGRIGGEEFVFALPETDLPHAFHAVERFRRTLAERDIELPDGGVIRVTASFGIAALESASVTVTEWIAAADKAMYAAKHAGRNRSERALSAQI
jgi:diguanylate cyclase (GGDEF)-like protein